MTMSKKNKPNKVKVVVDRPPMLEPGQYQARTTNCVIIGDKIVMTIEVNQNEHAYRAGNSNI